MGLFITMCCIYQCCVYSFVILQ